MESRASVLESLESRFEILEDRKTQVLVKEHGCGGNKLLYRIHLGDVKREERKWEIVKFLSQYKGLHLLPCMVTLRHSFVTGSDFYIAQEPISHGNLRGEVESFLTSHKVIREEKIKLWICQLLLALRALHLRKLVHGAVIAENVFMCKNRDTIRLGPTSEFLSLYKHPNKIRYQLDTFKTAKANIARGTTTDKFVTAMSGLESLEHIAPEMLNPTGAVNYSNDIWAAGILAFKMATLKAPFEGHTPVHIVVAIEKTKPDYEEILRRGYSPAFIDIVKQMLIKDPKQRPSADDLLALEFFPAGMCFG